MKPASRIKMAATVASVVRASTRPGAPSLPERLQAVPRLVRATVDGTYAGTTLKRLGLVAGAVAYVASPVDLLPEAVLPVIGAADDAVVISWAVKAFFEETERFIAWEVGEGVHRPRTRGGSGSWAPTGGRATEASRTTVRGEPLAVPGDPAAGAWAGGAEDGLRRDRDSTGAAAPGRLVSRVTRARGRSAPDDAGPEDRGRLPEGTRQAATDYVLESVRKRLER